MSRDPGALAVELDKIEPTLGNGTLGPLVKAGVKLLRNTEAAQRELYVISDFQQRAVDWESMDWPVNVILVPVASPRQDNLSITALEPISPFATVAVPFRVRLTIVNRGPNPAGRNVSVRVDDRVSAEQMVFVAGHASATVSVDLSFDKAGWKTIAAQLEDDALRADNRRTLCVEVKSQLSVLMCRPKAEGTLSRSFYLQKALNPGGMADTGVNIVECELAELAGRDPSECSVLFLVESAPADEESMSVVQNFVAAGGSIVIVAGPATDMETFNNAMAVNRSDLGPLSPARIKAAFGDERDPRTYQSIKEVDAFHPIFARLRRGDSPIDLAAPVFYRIVQTEPLEGAEVVAKFGSGDPAMLERPFGLGRVLLVASALHTDTTNLPVKVGFLPLMHSVVSYLTAAERPEGRRVGEALRLQIPKDRAPAVARIYRTPSESVEVKAQVKGALATFDFGTADGPGSVMLEWLSAEKIESRLVAINVDSEEGSLDRADLAKHFPAGTPSVKNPDELSDLLQKIRYGRNLAPFLLAAVLLLALVESILSNRFAFGSTSVR
jgi:hypothetical protein